MTSSSVNDTRRRTAGFSIVELLIGMAVLGVLLAVLGSLFLGTRRAYETNVTVTESAARVRTVIEFLEYDVALAGYTGLGAAEELTGPSLALKECHDAGCNPAKLPGRLLETLTVRYVEDRYTADGSAHELLVTYTVADGRLFRCESTGPDCPLEEPGTELAEGIAGLELVNYRTASGGPAAILPDDVSGVDLRLHYERSQGIAHEAFSIGLLNRPERD